MITKQTAVSEVPQLIEVHVKRLTKAFLLAADGNPAKTYLLGSNQVVIHVFSMAANRILSMESDKLHKAAEDKVSLKIQRPAAFSNTPIAKSCLHDFGRVMDAHANAIINRQLEVMLLTVKPGTAATLLVKHYDLDECHQRTLAVRADRMHKLMQKENAKKKQHFT